MYSLICHGPCNPARVSIDADVLHYRHAIGKEAGTISPVLPELAARLRTLRHTPHSCNPDTRSAECSNCGVIRRY